jgi:hypothetical protein
VTGGVSPQRIIGFHWLPPMRTQSPWEMGLGVETELLVAGLKGRQAVTSSLARQLIGDTSSAQANASRSMEGSHPRDGHSTRDDLRSQMGYG